MTIALSYSRLSDFRQCRLKFKMKYIDKEPNFQMKEEDKSIHLIRGGNVHKQLEQYVLAKLAGTPMTSYMQEVKQTAPVIDKIMENYGVMPENQVAVDKDFNKVSWFSKKAYFRVIFDLIGFGKDLLLVDYKTGKFRDYDPGNATQLGQLHLSALIGFAVWPEYTDCSTVYLYVDHKKSIPYAHIREESFEKMKAILVAEHELVNAETEFAPKQNQFCRWCDATPDQCKYAK